MRILKTFPDMPTTQITCDTCTTVFEVSEGDQCGAPIFITRATGEIRAGTNNNLTHEYKKGYEWSVLCPKCESQWAVFLGTGVGWWGLSPNYPDR